MVRVTLACHPATPCEAVRRIDTRVRLAPDGALSFTFEVTGEAAQLRLPAGRAPHRAHGLWEHTCFEAFIRARGTVYYEVNWSPSTEWAVYRFDDYRQGMTEAQIERAPTLVASPRAYGFELTGVIALSELPELLGSTRLEIAVAAVIEESDRRRSYWAITHPADRPDFHHPDGFVLELAQTIIARSGVAP